MPLEKKLIIANITDDVLLGADILPGDLEGPAEILFSKKIISFRGLEIPIEADGYPKKRFRRIHLADNYTIPAMTEVIVDVYIQGDDRTKDSELLVEPTPILADKYSVVMAPALVSVQNSTTQPVHLMNPFPKDIELHQNLVIGSAEAVDQITTFVEQEDLQDTENFHAVRNLKLDDHEGSREGNSKMFPETGKTVMPGHLTELFEETCKEKTSDQVKILTEFFEEYQDVFSKHELDIGRTHLTEHAINTGGAPPYKAAPRRVPFAYRNEADGAVQKFFDQGIVRESTSPWASPLVFVRKKNGKLRPCVDYRRLNSVTRKDAFPLPRIQDCFDTVADATLFSSMDITSAYNQIPIKEADIPKTAFVTKYGLFEFTVMPFGLCNAPATFQRVIELALAGLQWKTCLIYLDDCLVFSKTFDDHLIRLGEVLDRIRTAQLKLKPEKCHLLQSEVVYLGHILSAEGITPNRENVEKILHWRTPTNVKQVQSFLGMANYYRRFIPGYAARVRPLIDLTQKGKAFEWTPTCQEAFTDVKDILSSPQVMTHPHGDGRFILDCDACDVSIGAVLSQIQECVEKVIAYGSKTLSKAERNYCVTDKELLAVRYFTEYYRCYLLGHEFAVRTDHQALKWMFSLKHPKHRIARWIEALSEFDFTIEYRSGNKHGNADSMSRCPNPWTCECKDFSNLRCGPCKKCLKKNDEMSGVLFKSSKARSELPEKEEQEARVSKGDLRSAWPLKTPIEDVKTKQQEDGTIQPVVKWKESGTRPEGAEVQSASPATRHYLLNWDSLVVQDGVLYRSFHRKDGTVHLQLIIPKSIRDDVLHQMHDAILSGHLGNKKTREKILQRFYWYGLRDDVYNHIHQCDTCVSVKGPGVKPKAPLGAMPSGATLDRLSTDIVGPFPESNEGNRYILVVSDHFTKWVEVFEVPNQTATTCAEKILNEVIARFGCPYDLHSDQGRNYVSNIFVELCKLLDICKTRSSAYNIRCNGQTKRFNKTLVRMIKAYLKGQEKDWDKVLGCLAGAYRATVHESTGYSPNMLMLGREVRLPAQIMYSAPDNDHGFPSYSAYVEKLKERMERAHEVARHHLQKAASKQKRIMMLNVSSIFILQETWSGTRHLQ
jgi:hypothetical protein